MARVYMYLVIIVGLMMVFQMAGFNTSAGYILQTLNVVESPEDIKLTQFFVAIAGILSGLVIAGTIVASLFTRISPESILLLGYSSTLLLFVSDMTIIVTQATDQNVWIGGIVSLLIVPLIIGYVHSVISWWGGKA